MSEMQDYFPTKIYKRAETRMAALLRSELSRLEKLGPLTLETVKETLPEILEFTRKYHEAFMGYLAATLPQHENRVKCGANCGNCCRHFPMSIEPFEQIAFYASIRERSDLFSYLEACHLRVEKFRTLYAQAKNEIPLAEDPEEKALHLFFENDFPCPFLLESGSCGVYDIRPVTCRMYFSETNPEYCTARYLLTEKNRSFIVYLPDVIEETIADVSSYYENLDLSESLYAGMLELNALEGKLFV